MDKQIENLKAVIELLRSRGVVIESPYDLENWFEDYGTHSNMFATGLFGEDNDES